MLDLAPQVVGEVLELEIFYMQEGGSRQVFLDETKAKQYMGLANQLFEHVNGNFSAGYCFVGCAVFCKNLQRNSSRSHVHDCECSWTGSCFGRDTGHCCASNYIPDLIDCLHSIHSSGSRIRAAAHASCYS